METMQKQDIKINYMGKGKFRIPKEEVLKLSPTMDIFIDSLGNACGESSEAAKAIREILLPILPDGCIFDIDGNDDEWYFQIVKPIEIKFGKGGGSSNDTKQETNN